MDKLFQELQKEINTNCPEYNMKRIGDAYEMARRSHIGQMRGTGEPFIIHPVEVAKLISNLKLDENSIIASLLHDTLEDTDLSREEIKDTFGKDVLKLVEGVTKLRGTRLQSTDSKDIENFKKLILASTKDVRILLIKLADRLHNARTIEGLPKSRQVSYAKEILDVFAPLSSYLGVSSYQREFEDIAFSYLNPEEYKKIKKQLDTSAKIKAESIDSFSKEVGSLLRKHGIKPKVYGRKKSIYSTYRKMQRYARDKEAGKLLTVDDLFDLLAIRVIVNSVEQCYRTLGVIHQKWEYVPEEFDDYISRPKPNGYRSIHTVLLTNEWGAVEVQIRTMEMHKYNEYGPASHIGYKLSGKRNAPKTNAFNWVRNLARWQREKEKISKNDFKVSLFDQNIFVFTPKGALIELPNGSTPLDFAYHIHTSVGHNCIGVKINGEMASLGTKLKTGDQVEIIVSKAKQYPKQDWLKLVKTSSAKAKIRRGLRERDEIEAENIGRDLVYARIKPEYNLSEKEIDSKIAENINTFKVANLSELYSRVGHKLLGVDSIKPLFESKKKETKKRNQKDLSSSRRPTDVKIEGKRNIQVEFAKCCNPQQGDKIVAYITSDSKTKIHKKSCNFLKTNKVSKSRIYEASWN